MNGDEGLEAKSSPSSLSSAPMSWAAYLGCSWTWCIGMFLPVLLVRDLGVWGWVVFAVPNVVGAAAMGWVLRDGEMSRGLVARHGPACRAFSIVTIAFHAFFATWILARLLDPISVAVVGALAGVLWLLARRDEWSSLRAAWGVFAISAAAFVMVLYSPPMAEVRLPAKWTADLLWLAPVCVLGFALCPYLDLTFHRARQANGTAGARKAFAFGFGGFFLTMILFSLVYAPLLAGLAGGGEGGTVPRLLRGVIGLHMLVQIAFTLSVHAEGMRQAGAGWGTGAITGVAVAGALLLGWMPPGGWGGMSGGEIVYRCFMAFYGLIFPAYVWICMVPGREQRTWTALAGAIAVAGPMFAMGFLGGRMIWLVPGVAVVVLARWAAGKRGVAHESPQIVTN